MGCFLAHFYEGIPLLLKEGFPKKVAVLLDFVQITSALRFYSFNLVHYKELSSTIFQSLSVSQ